MQYRIAWRIQRTGYTGHGEWFTEDRRLTEDWLNFISKEYDGVMDHWIEERAE